MLTAPSERCLGSEVTRKYGAAGLPDDTIKITFTGSAGQSFGAFIPRGITMTLCRRCQRRLRQGLVGGKVIAYPAQALDVPLRGQHHRRQRRFYGATSGEAYVRGVAG
jgi:glutamate synthase (ferredoxin)